MHTSKGKSRSFLKKYQQLRCPTSCDASVARSQIQIYPNIFCAIAFSAFACAAFVACARASSPCIVYCVLFCVLCIVYGVLFVVLCFCVCGFFALCPV